MTLSSESQAVHREKASRFIGIAFPIIDEATFKERLAAITREHFSARHVCYAWVLGEKRERQRAVDAGEPKGTAGRPILQQLQGSAVTNAAVVVVRYFGGTLLGKGGLARAYAEAARAALAQATIIQNRIMLAFTVHCRYDQVDALHTEVLRAGGEVRSREFGERCALTVAVPRSVSAGIVDGWIARGIDVHQLK